MGDSHLSVNAGKTSVPTGLAPKLPILVTWKILIDDGEVLAQATHLASASNAPEYEFVEISTEDYAADAQALCEVMTRPPRASCRCGKD